MKAADTIREALTRAGGHPIDLEALAALASLVEVATAAREYLEAIDTDSRRIEPEARLRHALETIEEPK